MENVFTSTIAPIVGGVLGVLMFLSPIRATMAARRQNNIGALNPFPSLFAAANCAAWIAYAFVTMDWYILVPNCLGMLVAMFLFLVTFGLGIEPLAYRDRILLAALGLAAAVFGLATTERMILDTQAQKQTLWGIGANTLLALYYVSPLTTIYTVLRNRDSTSLAPVVCACNTANGTMWVIYGLTLQDPYIWAPNGFGAVVGVFTLALCFLFPRNSQPSKACSL